jgi:predicted metal-binding membrane protein
VERRVTNVAFSLRQSAGLATTILIVAMFAWLGTILWVQGMELMPGTMGMTLASFAVMWTLMMAAVMLPSAMPMITLYVRTIRDSYWLRTTAFGGGYLLAWGLSSVPAFLLVWMAGEIHMKYMGWTTVAAVLVFASAGVYQLSPLKYRCLHHCRSPLGHLLHYGNYRGSLRDVRAGAHHGFFCLGCCWALMLLMIAFGVMNLLAMALLATVIGIEKHWRHGERFARAVGVGSLALAVVVIFVPEFAPGIISR